MPQAGAVYEYTTRAAMAASSNASLASRLAWCDETGGIHEFVPNDASSPDGWVVIASTGTQQGNWLFRSEEFVLSPKGGGVDDWPTLVGSLMPAAAYKKSIRMLAGTWVCKSVLVVQNGTILTADPGVTVDVTIQATNNLFAPFCAAGVSVSSTTLAANTNVGDNTVQITADLGLIVGDFIRIFLTNANFRGAMYQVRAIAGVGPFTVTLDRPIRMRMTSQTSIASFPLGSYVEKYAPARDVTISGNGMRIFGACARFFEMIGAWRCSFSGAVLGDGSATTATERLGSIDETSYDCSFDRIYGDGGNTTPLGLTFESTDECYIRDCVVRNCGSYGFSFQDAQGSHAIDCEGVQCGGGAAFTAASDNVLGADECSVVRGNYSGNATHGIVWERGSSRCRVEGATANGNTNDGMQLSGGAWTLFFNKISGGSQSSYNGSNGIDVGANSVETKIDDVDATSNVNGLLVAGGATRTCAKKINVSLCSTAPIVSTADLDLDFAICTAPAAFAGPIASIQGGVCRMRGCDFTMTAGGDGISVTGGAVLDIDQSTVTSVNGGVGIRVNNAGSSCHVGSGTRLVGHGAGGFGLIASAGTIFKVLGYDCSPYLSQAVNGLLVMDLYGTGSPLNNVVASVGSTFRRSDGGAGTSFYVKEAANDATGWVGK